jgi:hypothetical protein
MVESRLRAIYPMDPQRRTQTIHLLDPMDQMPVRIKRRLNRWEFFRARFGGRNDASSPCRNLCLAFVPRVPRWPGPWADLLIFLFPLNRQEVKLFQELPHRAKA